jgi:hypothetical protein
VRVSTALTVYEKDLEPTFDKEEIFVENHPTRHDVIVLCCADKRYTVSVSAMTAGLKNAINWV